MAALAVGAVATAAMVIGALGISRVNSPPSSSSSPATMTRKMTDHEGYPGMKYMFGENGSAFRPGTTTDVTPSEAEYLYGDQIVPKTRGNPGTSYLYDEGDAPRAHDPYGLKHSTYEADFASPGWDDQDWSWDSEAHRGNMPTVPLAPLDRGPLYGEHVPLPIGDMGDALSDMAWGTGRDRSTELEWPPERTKTYTCHPLDYGGQLMPHEIPHGAREATDLQFWGPTDWDAERNSRKPSYLDNTAMEYNGKEINRPLDDFGWQDFEQDPGFAEKGAEDVDYSDGQASARSTNVRLMQRNRYGGFVTTKEAYRPKFLPPTPARASGGGQPGEEPEITFGARLSKLFSAFLGERNIRNKAPAEYAEVTLDQSKKLDYTPRLGNGRPPGGAQPPGPQVNPVQGGRMRRTDDQLQLPSGLAKPRIAASGSLDINPYQGYHYTSRETEFSWGDNTVGKSRAGKNGYLLLGNPQLEYRQRKEPDDMQAYQAPRTGARGSIYGGEDVHGIIIPNVKSSGVTERTLGKGGRNIMGSSGIITLRSNITKGLKGGDWDDSPETQDGFIDLRTPRSVAIIGGRTKEALDDLMDVEHS